MKKFTSFLIVLLWVFTSACEEMPPYIAFSDPTPIDLSCEDKRNLNKNEFSKTNTNYISDELPEIQCKMALVEEFTGVRCVRCPNGHKVLAEILADYPDQVAGVTMHAGFLSEPYPENKENYVLSEGTFLFDLLQSNALPSAAVDRVHYDGEQFTAMANTNAWTGKVNERLQLEPPLNLYTNYEYNKTTRTLQVFVRAHYLQPFDNSAEHQLSVRLSESGIIDYQLVPDGNSSEIISDYEHNHVLRAMLTPVTGITLEVEKVEGMVVERAFEMTLPAHWQAKNMEIIASVHETAEGHVLQAAKKYIEEE